ncbi:DUF742 domain-containing protein [Actinoplanes sp. GCM10030250]|uniref:DUF742 domain-containing protein n=1 Tax=Actinoplanes sp. GCM10030250 TaxID=3273376 RepID=UPI00360D0869
MFTQDVWYDEDAGPLVRLYAITGGRSEAPASGITLSAIVQRVPGATASGELSGPESTIMQLAERPVSVSEIAAWLRLPLGPVRVLLSDLRDAGLITLPRSPDTAAGPTKGLLEQVLSGLRSL